MSLANLYIVENLESARDFLSNFHEPVIITNKIGSTRYYGIMVIDYMLKKLKAEFLQVTNTVITIYDDDFASLCTATKLKHDFQLITTQVVNEN